METQSLASPWQCQSTINSWWDVRPYNMPEYPEEQGPQRSLIAIVSATFDVSDVTRQISWTMSQQCARKEAEAALRRACSRKRIQGSTLRALQHPKHVRVKECQCSESFFSLIRSALKLVSYSLHGSEVMLVPRYLIVADAQWKGEEGRKKVRPGPVDFYNPQKVMNREQKSS